MAFLNQYKRKSVRRTNEYQVLMEDLVSLGVVKEVDYNRLIGREKNSNAVEVPACVYKGVEKHCDQICHGCSGYAPLED